MSFLADLAGLLPLSLLLRLDKGPFLKNFCTMVFWD